MNIWDAIKLIWAEFRKPTTALSYTDLRPLIIKREHERLAKICDIKKAEQFARAVVFLYGFNPWAVFVQAWHESGAFRRVIGKHNYWGIKKPQNWAGMMVSVTTHEYVNGVKTKMVLDFLDFDNLAVALIWYSQFIARMYPNAYINRDNPESFFMGLVNGKFQYATDPRYVPKLTALYHILKKNIWLKETLK